MKEVNIFLAVLVVASAFWTITNESFAALDPKTKDCLQRGYTVDYDLNAGVKSCLFPDASKCPLDDFNNGVCGSEFMIKEYCVKNGSPVWDKDKCCEGTVAYLKPNNVGQPACLEISWIERIYNQLRYNSNAWIIGGILLVIIMILIIKRRKNNI